MTASTACVTAFTLHPEDVPVQTLFMGGRTLHFLGIEFRVNPIFSMITLRYDETSFLDYESYSNSLSSGC